MGLACAADPMSSHDDMMSRRSFLGILMASLAAVSIGSNTYVWAAGSKLAAIPKSLWVWRTPLSAFAGVLDIVRRHGFQTVFYSFPMNERQALFTGETKEADVIRAFREQGRRFYAVAGDPTWTRRPTALPRPVEVLLDFQARSRLFDGICLDIEPQVLPEWSINSVTREDESVMRLQHLRLPALPDHAHPKELRIGDNESPPEIAGRRQEIVQSYLELLTAIAQTAVNQNIRVVATVAPAYANLQAPGGEMSMLEAAAKQVQETILMAYRNTPEAAMRVAHRALLQLENSRKPWWFGVTTSGHSLAPNVSYAGATPGQFSTAMSDLHQRLSRHGDLYQGIAVNAYPSLRTILGT